MAFPTAELPSALEDDFVDPPVPVRRIELQPPPRGLTVEAMAWIALLVLSFGPVIGYLLATLL